MSLIRRTTIIFACVLLCAAGCAYGGGNWIDSRSRGFDLVDNFVCDLFLSTSINGSPNSTSSILASIGFACALLSLAIFAHELTALLPERRVRIVHGSMLMGIIAAPIVILTASTSGMLHPVSIAVTGLAILFAYLLLGIFGTWQFYNGKVFILSAAFFSTLDGMLYAGQVIFHPPPSHMLPLLQKLAAIAIAFMLVFSNSPRRKQVLAD